jgi:alkylation response protein AidB-like acyl-CoA dehydrogenase
MDWAFTEEQEQLAGLVRQILDREVNEERRRSIDTTDDRFDRALWTTLQQAGVLDGLGLVELCRVFVELGRAVAPVPIAPAIAALQLGTSERIVTPALVDDPGAPVEADGSVLTGTKTTVPAGMIAEAFLVSASGGGLFLVDRQAAGVSVTEQLVTSTDKEALLELDAARGSKVGGDEMEKWLADHLTVAICAHQLGVCERALELTAGYAKQRVQFDRPIATFQAVGQRLADAYIDVHGIRLTLWQAAWRLSEGLDADQEIATAKFWAADAGHRIAHTAVHVHGGMGIDLDYHLHRYFTAAKRNEFALGGATEQLVRVGRALATEPA